MGGFFKSQHSHEGSQTTETRLYESCRPGSHLRHRQHTDHCWPIQQTPLCHVQPTQHEDHKTHSQRHHIQTTSHQYSPSHWLTGHCWLHQHGNSSVWHTGKRTEHSHMQTKAGYMQCVVATGDGYVILDKSDPGKVHWVDSQGRVTHTCGNREGEGLNDPRHMVRTSWEQLVVVDIYNYRLTPGWY